jgi:hypothetical protein
VRFFSVTGCYVLYRYLPAQERKKKCKKKMSHQVRVEKLVS